MWNRGPLKDLKDSKLSLNESKLSHEHLGSVWYHSEPSGVPYSLNQQTGSSVISINRPCNNWKCVPNVKVLVQVQSAFN